MKAWTRKLEMTKRKTEVTAYQIVDTDKGRVLKWPDGREVGLWRTDAVDKKVKTHFEAQNGTGLIGLEKSMKEHVAFFFPLDDREFEQAAAHENAKFVLQRARVYLDAKYEREKNQPRDLFGGAEIDLFSNAQELDLFG